MKKIYKIGYVAILTVVVGVTSCSDKFLEEKRNYGNFNAADSYGSATAATERINNLYFWMLPVSTGGSGNGTNAPNDWTSVGNADDWSRSTLEYGGISTQWINPQVELTYENVYDHFFVANDTYSPWGHIRNCNDIIEGVQNSSSISDDEKKPLLGQAYFFRAYMYYSMVKLYGGVPIIDHVQEPVGQSSTLAIPRQTTKDCIDFICGDLDKAASMLPSKWTDGTDYGRVTAGLAQALKGYVLLFYASPLFNRADNTERWQVAYEANKKALEMLEQGGFGLAYATTGGAENAKNWNRIWTTYDGGEVNGSIREGVFVTLHNTNDNVSGQPDYGKWNRWEHAIRPRNTNGGGGLTPTAEMVDLFPMADGKKPSESAISYDKKKFWLNRDPRFYRTFAFPGTEWKFDEGGASLSDPTLGSIVPADLYPTGRQYQLWSYQWTDNAKDQASTTTSSGYWPDLLSSSADKAGGHSVYVRKRTLDANITAGTLYTFLISNSNPKGFMKSAAPLLTVRYAEVLLNFAEAAAGAGHPEEAEAALQKIRARVGYTAANNYGLASMSSRQEALKAVFYERQIELAYEGKLFDTMRRWMLFDGGEGQAALKSSWALTGFDGNTCTYLGVNKLNGQKRHSIVLYCKDVQATDPVFDKRPTALTLNEDMSCTDGTYADSKVEALANFYDSYLERKDVNADGNDDALTINYYPKYYLPGLRVNAMQNNVTLHQTVGWHDFGRNADGLFDPLSDTLP